MLDAAAGDAQPPRHAAVTAGRRRQRPDRAGVLWALGLTALILLPIWLRPGFVLSYDLVAVPQQRLQPWMWGAGEAPPRAVPQDVLVSLLDDLIPGALLQRILLTAVVLGAGAGMAWLAAPHGRVGQVVAVSAFTWSAYLYERLVIGHWGLLLAYAALPWLVAASAAARRGDPRAAPLIVLVVALGTWVPTGGVLLVVVAVPLILWPATRMSLRARVLTTAAVLAVQLTWVVPGIMTATSSQVASLVFGVRPGDVVGALVAVLGGGGIWNPRAAPPSGEGLLAVLAALVVVGGLVLGLPGVRRGLGGRTLTPFLLVSAALALWALATAWPALDGFVAAGQRLPGGGLLRDSQKWLAPWWLLCSLAFGAAAARLRDRIPSRDAARILPYALALVPLVLLPDLALGALGRLTPARYPAGWEASRAVLAQAPDDDLVVALPWSTFRRYTWNDDRTVLDPAPRYLPRTVVTDMTLLVSGPQGDPIVVPGDDALSRRVEQALRTEEPLGALRGLGVGWVLLERGQPAAPGAPAVPDLAGARRIVGTEDLELYRIPGQVAAADRPTVAPVLGAWLVLAVVTGTAIGCLIAGRRDGEG